MNEPRINALLQQVFWTTILSTMDKFSLISPYSVINLVAFNIFLAISDCLTIAI